MKYTLVINLDVPDKYLSPQSPRSATVESIQRRCVAAATHYDGVHVIADAMVPAGSAGS